MVGWQYPFVDAIFWFLGLNASKDDEFHEQVKMHENQIIAAITRVHHYMINYGSVRWADWWIAAATVDKAVSFLDSIIMNDSILHYKLIQSTVVAFVTDSPEPYSVSYGLILINRNQLIGEKVLWIVGFIMSRISAISPSFIIWFVSVSPSSTMESWSSRLPFVWVTFAK